MEIELKYNWGKFTPKDAATKAAEILRNEFKFPLSHFKMIRKFIKESFTLLPSEAIIKMKDLPVFKGAGRYCYIVAGISVYRPDLKYVRRYIILGRGPYLYDRQIVIEEGNSTLFDNEKVEYEDYR